MPGSNSRSSRRRHDLAKLPALVRLVKALEEAVAAVERIEADYGLSAEQRKNFGATLQRELARRLVDERLDAERLPSKPPEQWADRAGRKENPVAFIRRVYAPWLTRGLKRGDIRTLDLPLYRALAVWMHRHPTESFPEFGIEGFDMSEDSPIKERSWAEDLIKAGRRLAKQPGDK